MSAALGVLLGAGVFLLWWACLAEEAPRAAGPRRPGRLRELLLRADLARVGPAGLLAACAAAGTLSGLLVAAVTGPAVLGLCAAVLGGWVPLAVVQHRARRRVAALREVWPDVIDHLRSAIRAGMSLPEALIQLQYRGPEPVRPAFTRFAADYRASGQLQGALTLLKDRLADLVADNIVEALRVTREVGGTDLGRLLGTLSEFLRENARTSGELEARQSWTVNAARLAVAAPWIVLALMATQPAAIRAYDTPAGALVLIGGLLVSTIAYRLMLRIGALPEPERVLR
ncbi:type II secretion system F family protein [Kocuria rosea]|uniref:type II secretion system F family protein n=1 Tax=Kocuria rosea TaxID=1275 RepID=UPI000F6D30F8|nr:type II secretion system F family protein [Kocuria rosea]VEI49334.1 Flp pilus assembly protein TadB [Kocuria rosea]